jgi:hypothetical protein
MVSTTAVLLRWENFYGVCGHLGDCSGIGVVEIGDVDILIEFEEPTFRNFMNLAFFLVGSL